MCNVYQRSHYQFHKHLDEVLIWIPEDNWAMDVDKLLNSSADTVTPSKRPRLKDRKEQLVTCYTEYLMATQREVMHYFSFFK